MCISENVITLILIWGVNRPLGFDKFTSSVCYKKRKRHGTDCRLSAQFCQQTADSVPQIHGTFFLFVLSETMVSQSSLSSHTISPVSLQRKGENITTTAWNVDSC